MEDQRVKKKGFRYYLAGLLGESQRKNIAQMTNNIIGALYDNVYNFISFSPWDEQLINERRLQIMNQGDQTKIRNGFSLIIDD
ncbi:MAG: transposase [Trichodesmium sp. St2_bin6]|nr:transposase [Trichodesmium sp. St2_bin6]